MSGDYIVVVGITDLIPLVRVYYLDKRKEFQCVTTKIEKPFNREACQGELCAFGEGEIAMIEGMINTKGIAEVSIEPKKLTVHRHSWCEWEDVEHQVRGLIESVLGEKGDFIPTI
jgi:hypothetical protein